jgi:hypothetical protein
MDILECEDETIALEILLPKPSPSFAGVFAVINPDIECLVCGLGCAVWAVLVSFYVNEHTIYAERTGELPRTLNYLWMAEVRLPLPSGQVSSAKEQRQHYQRCPGIDRSGAPIHL